MHYPATLAILIVTATVSILAFRDQSIKERWMFKPREILAGKQFERLLTSGFLHADWMHLGFNAYSFLAFGQTIEVIYGLKTLLLIYFSSILGGSLLSLFIHRNEEYSALGASGGVCGVLFASIFLLPGGSIMLFPIPLSIPAFLFAILFLIVSFVRMRKRADNIGHDAHLGGAIIGLLVAAALYPSLMTASPAMFAGVLLLSILILVATIFDPLQLLEKRLAEGTSREGPAGSERFRRYDEVRERNRKIKEIDKLLDKVAANGMQSLSKSERERLDKLSKELHGGR